MIEIKEVRTKKDQKMFLDFPLRMYKGNKYFVPPLYADEKKIFSKDYVYYETCEAVYYLAFKNGKIAGRISGILQKASNEKRNEKRIRFTRFDSINDIKVAKALFDAVEKWGKSKGMDTICGPLGFSDLEREGLLIEGFNELSTFEEQYNFEYYGKLIEKCGYKKEVDWVESKIYPPEKDDGSLRKMADFIMKRYNLHFGPAKDTEDFINRYSEQFFALLDVAYYDIYGTVPFTEGTKKMLLDNFKMVIDINHVAVVLDENDKVVCLGLCFPSLAKAVQKSYGHLTPAAALRLIKAIKHPKILDLGLIAVDPEYLNRGVNAIITAELLRMLKEDGIKYAETNLNLENNYAIQNQWKRFKAVQHKRRRSYVKKLTDV
ncbi:N-acetyltransferase [Eubacterium ruminantium]|uniref:N-acetyltransferase n=1 Tax=Eubacterium ruminantium TaxID=42322 RepID=UPI00156969F0|nr:N-acetyltransferase [Eubacterium ruminantium]